MKIDTKYPQLFLRIAVGLGFIIPVLDRLGILGMPGEKNISWGEWDAFIKYTGMLMPFLGPSLVNFFGTVASILEVTFGMALIIGFRIRWAAFGSFALTLIFGISMFIFFGYKAPFNYSVFSVSAGCLLLLCIPDFAWSLDHLLAKSGADNKDII